MFLETFDEDQLRSFGALARRVMLADGHAHESELALIQHMIDNFGIADGHDDLEDLVWTPEVFPTKGSARAVLIEGAAVAMADGHLHEEEVVALHNVGTSLGLEAHVVSLAIDFARRLSSLSDEATRFVARGFSDDA